MYLLDDARPRRSLAALTAVLLTVGGCGQSTGHGTGLPRPVPSGLARMLAVLRTRADDGLATSVTGYRFALVTPVVPARVAASLSYRIIGGDGRPVTAFGADQTKLMHLYLIRADLTGYQHLHPTMAADGTWTAPVEAAEPGRYRAFVTFIAGGADGPPVRLTLSDDVRVDGTAPSVPLPPVTTTASADGYTVTVTGALTSGRPGRLVVSVGRDGRPVHELESYLGTYAHLTAFHEGDLAFAHMHPNGTAVNDRGGPDLTAHAMLPRVGAWRLFVQFKTGGVVHTAAVTLAALPPDWGHVVAAMRTYRDACR